MWIDIFVVMKKCEVISDKILWSYKVLAFYEKDGNKRNQNLMHIMYQYSQRVHFANNLKFSAFHSHVSNRLKIITAGFNWLQISSFQKIQI